MANLVYPPAWRRALLTAAGAVATAFTDSRTWPLAHERFQANHGYVFPPSLTVRLIRLFLEAGICLTPATSIWDPRSWFVCFRYATSFAGTGPKLRLVNGSNYWDDRLLAVLSEEIAVGATAVVARDVLNVVHIADALPLIRKGLIAYRQPPLDPKRPELRPDYFCLTSANEALFVESKGAVGTAGDLTGDITKGKLQVGNVDCLSHLMRPPHGNRIVVATNICIDGIHPRSETATRVIDPTEPAVRHRDKGDPTDYAIRVAYAKVLNLAGLAGLGDLLLAGIAFPEALSGIVGTLEPSKRKFVLLGEFPIGGLLWLYEGVWKVLRTSRDIAAGLTEPLGELHELTEGERDEYILLNNGVLLSR